MYISQLIYTMIFKKLMVSKLLKSKISNNRVAPYLKHTHKVNKNCKCCGE